MCTYVLYVDEDVDDADAFAYMDIMPVLGP